MTSGRRFQGIVFDLDGTIVNSEHLYKAAWLATLPKWGLAIDPDDYGPVFAGRPGMDTARYHFGLPEPDALSLLEAVLIHFWSIAPGQFTTTPGMVELLDRLAEVPLAIATSGRRADVTRILAELDLGGRFRTVVTADDVSRGKPDPEPFLLAAAGLGITPERCIAFEDAPNGLRSARSAGMYCVGIGEHADHLRPLADLVIADFNDPALEELISSIESGAETGR